MRQSVYMVYYIISCLLFHLTSCFILYLILFYPISCLLLYLLLYIICFMSLLFNSLTRCSIIYNVIIIIIIIAIIINIIVIIIIIIIIILSYLTHQLFHGHQCLNISHSNNLILIHTASQITRNQINQLIILTQVFYI